MTVRRGLLSVIVIATGFSQSGSILSAEDAAEAEDAKQLKTLNEALVHYQTVLKHFAAIHIEHLREAASLDAGQVKTLTEAASQSANARADIVRRAMLQYLERSRKQVGRRGIPGRTLGSLSRSLGRSDRSIVLREKNWTKALDEILDEDQQRVLDDLTESRDQWRKRALTDSTITMLDTQVFLSSRQREGVAQRIAPQINEQLAKTYSMIGMNRGTAIVLKSIKSISLEEYKTVLTPAQLRWWPSQTNTTGGPWNIARKMQKLPDGQKLKPGEISLIAEKACLEQELAMRRELLTLECQLTEQQQRKLSVAAKGVVDRLLAELKAGRDKDEPDPRRDLVRFQNQVPQARVRLVRGGGALLRFQTQQARRKAVDDPFWKKAVERTLSDEQQFAWQKVCEERTAFRRRAVIQSALVSIDEYVPLTAKQRSMLADSTDELVARLDADALRTAAAQGLARVGLDQIRELPEESVNSVLSDTQMVLWQDYFTWSQ